MKIYTYNKPVFLNDKVIGNTKYTVTEEDIIELYWEYWNDSMIKVGKRSQCTRQNCIDDFVVVNWASEVK